MSPEGDLSSRQLFELRQIQKELKLIGRLLGRGGRLGPNDIKMRAAAGSLHSIYNGIEKMLEFAIEAKGIPIPKGPSSHSELLAMAKSNGIISESLEEELRAYMGFRHFYRHSYGFMIDNELLNPLLRKVGSVVSKLAVELNVEHSGA